MNTDQNDQTPALPSRLLWRRTDGEPIEGEREVIMRQYAAAGFTGTATAVTVGIG